MAVDMTVNGKALTIDLPSDTPLLWALRDELKLTGTKFGCGIAQCGACTVHINGTPMRSCVTPISAVSDADITTIEGLDSKVADAVQQAWATDEVPQCGYCQSGQVMSAVGLLKTNATPNDDDIDAAMSGNICRCATYQRIRQAIHTAADTLAKEV